MSDDTTGARDAYWFVCANDCGIALRVMGSPLLLYAAAKVRAKACGWTERVGDDGDILWTCPRCQPRTDSEPTEPPKGADGGTGGGGMSDDKMTVGVLIDEFAEKHGYAGLRRWRWVCRCSVEEGLMPCLEWNEGRMPVDCVFWKAREEPDVEEPAP